MAHDKTEKILGLLGLALRAGQLALGFSAVEKLVRRGQKPLVIVATDVGASQLGKIRNWTPVRGRIEEVLTGDDMARAFGRNKLSVVGISDPGFVKGIEKLVAEAPEGSA